MIIQLHKGRSFISRLIGFQTRGVYTHASIAVNRWLRFEAREFRGVGFSEKILGESIDYFKINLTLEQQEKCVEFMRSVNGYGYDYKMVARFMSRRGEDEDTKNKFFCSELVFDMLAHAGVLLFNNTKGWEVSPHLLSRSTVIKKVKYEDIDFNKDCWAGDIVELLRKCSEASR